jgi:uncharacterized membrane protein
VTPQPRSPSQPLIVATALTALLLLGAGVGLFIVDGHRSAPRAARVAVDSLLVMASLAGLVFNLLALRRLRRRP